MNAHQHKSATTVSLRVRVDRTLCQGHARCVALAPELFEADEFGGGREIGDGGVPSELENKAWLAMKAAMQPGDQIYFLSHRDGRFYVEYHILVGDGCIIHRLLGTIT